jgi:hypothetical protein
MTTGDRVTQLYRQALGTHFSRLLGHAWVTVGLFFNPDHHTGKLLVMGGYTQITTSDINGLHVLGIRERQCLHIIHANGP